jgi:hypothetical protein
MKKKSKISNVEWGLFIGALIVIDIAQIILEWLVIVYTVLPLYAW